MPFPVDILYIVQAEESLGVTFPEEFRLQMMKTNGGEIDTGEDTWEIYPFLDKSEQTRLKHTCNDIVLETEQARKWSTFPPDAVAIAANGCGDQLIYLPVGKNQLTLGSKIYEWLHETGEVKLVADEISSLIK